MQRGFGKVRKANKAKPDPLEENIAKAIFDLEVGSPDLRGALRDLFFTKAHRVTIGKTGKVAVVLMVPFRQLVNFQGLHSRLVHELEKKFAGKQLFIIGQRKIEGKPKTISVRRARARTLTHVHESMLDDLCYPTTIMGKRTRIGMDGSQHMVVYLDPKSKNEVENKMDTFSSVYKRLSGKNVVFEFAVDTL